MRAVVAEGPGSARLVELPEPVPGPGQVVVRVVSALTCGTDLKLLRRGHPKIPFPVTLGHEFAGVVESAGEGAPFAPDERVTSAVTSPCGSCDPCRALSPNLCATAFDEPLWGAFAERLLVPARLVSGALRRIPPALPFATAALLDPVASALRGLSRVPLGAGTTLFLFGSGPMALLLAALAKERGVGRLFVAGRRPTRLAAFASTGAVALDVGMTDFAAALRDATSGRGPDVVVDTSGDPTAVASLASLVAKGGSLLLFAGMARDASVTFPAGRLHYDEVSVVGSFHYTPADADQALDLLARGRLPVASVISASRPLADFAGAFDAVSRGEAMKIELVP